MSKEAEVDRESESNDNESFEEVFAKERESITARRVQRNIDGRAGYAGLALSGGGIRSAATCIGAVQALRVARRLDSIDYLSTVSGGGYAGACLTAALSENGGRRYPYGDDVSDSPVLAHIRNYSNYLMPRSRSKLRSLLESFAILLRGLLANGICVLAFLLPAVAVTAMAFTPGSQLEPNFLPALATHVNRSLSVVPKLRHIPIVPAFFGLVLTALLVV